MISSTRRWNMLMVFLIPNIMQVYSKRPKGVVIAALAMVFKRIWW